MQKQFRVLFVSKDNVFKKVTSVILSKNFNADVIQEDEINLEMSSNHDLQTVDFVIYDMDYFDAEHLNEIRTIKKIWHSKNFIAMYNKTSPVDMDDSIFLCSINKNRISLGFAAAINKLESKNKQSKPSGFISTLDKLGNSVSMDQLLNIMNKRRALV